MRNKRRSGVSALDLLTIVLIVLKVVGYIDSWWWVAFPSLTMLGIGIAIVLFAKLVEALSDENK